MNILNNIRCSIAILLSVFVAVSIRADQVFIADFNSASLDPGLQVHIWDGVNYISGTGPNWAVTSGGGQMAIGITAEGQATLPVDQWNDGPHVQTTSQWLGDFVATVTMDVSGTNNMGGGFYLDTLDGSFLGIGMASWGWIGLSTNLAYSASASIPSLVSTFRLSRSGDTVTVQYMESGTDSFITLASVSDPALAGAGWFDLTAGVNDNPGTANAVVFSDFSVEPVSAPDAGSSLLFFGLSLAGLLGCRRHLQK